jgi:hypothetical protein
MVAHIYNPSIQAKARDQEFRDSTGYIARPSFSKTTTKKHEKQPPL